MPTQAGSSPRPFLPLVRSVICIISREHSVFRAPLTFVRSGIASREKIVMTLLQRSKTVVGTFHFGLEAERALRKLRDGWLRSKCNRRRNASSR